MIDTLAPYIGMAMLVGFVLFIAYMTEHNDGDTSKKHLKH